MPLRKFPSLPALEPDTRPQKQPAGTCSLMSAKDELLASTGRVNVPPSTHEPFGPVTRTGPLMAILEACREARVGRTTVFGEIRAGRLRAVKLGRRTLIRRTDFDAWLAALPPVKGKS